MNKSPKMKYVVVTGGVISGVGKGIVASSAGLLLKSLGIGVTCIKIDPYINVDASGMSPLEHGEVYVTDDGGQLDLDLGNYERYLSISLRKENHITTGKIYDEVIKAERRGDYLGKTVQVVPHITDAIQGQIEHTAEVCVDKSDTKPDVCIIELGGTVGDIESAPFIYALAQLRKKVGKGNFVQIHVSYVPIIPPGASGEQKTKPTQRSISDVRSAGLDPDLIACRCETQLHPATVQKIATTCSLGKNQVLSVHDESTTYHVPILLKRQKLLAAISKLLHIPSSVQVPRERLARGTAMWKDWLDLVQSQEIAKQTVSVALVGQYVENHNAYLSISRALEHASMYCHTKLNILWINAADLADETLEDEPAKFHKAWHDLCSAQGVLVPGEREAPHWRGMLQAIGWASENKKPFLGIGMGFEVAVLHHAMELYPSLFPDWKMPLKDIWTRLLDYANMDDDIVEDERLGMHQCLPQAVFDHCKVGALYGMVMSLAGERRFSGGYQRHIRERYRHTRLVSPGMANRLESKSRFLVIAKDESNLVPAIMEMHDHPWFVGVQFEPQFTSRVLQPNKIILGFFAASAGCLDDVTQALVLGQRSLKGGRSSLESMA